MLLGRDHERERLAGLLREARAGRSTALVVRGDVGVGKSALLEYAVAHARQQPTDTDGVPENSAPGKGAPGSSVPGSGAGDSGTSGSGAPGHGAPFTVLRATGNEYEAELPFAGLHMLVRPVLGAVDALPELQASALRNAFRTGSPATPGRPAADAARDRHTDADEPHISAAPRDFVAPGAPRRGADPADRFLTGLAVLSLLAETAETGPLLCVVDDAQWLDRASAEALLFAARRLDNEGVVLLFGVRTPAPPLPGIPDLTLHGLDRPTAALLLDRHAAHIPAALRTRIIDESAGNPLALIELPAALTSAHNTTHGTAHSTAHGTAQHPAHTVPPHAAAGALPLSERLQRAFGDQFDRLDPAARLLLTVAAAETTGDLGVILRAGTELGLTPQDLDHAEHSGLIRVDTNTVAFRHPLVRACVVRGTALTDRLAAHSALAAILDDRHSADRRAWHLAEAAIGPDADVAAALEATAHRARERSGHAAEAAALERAADLTPEPDLRVRRLTAAAEASIHAGVFDRALELTRTVENALSPDSAHHARLACVRSAVEFERGSPGTAGRLLLAGATAAATDPAQSVPMLIDAVRNAYFAGDAALANEAADRLHAIARPEHAVFADAMRGLAALLAGDPANSLPRMRALVTATLPTPSTASVLPPLSSRPPLPPPGHRTGAHTTHPATAPPPGASPSPSPAPSPPSSPVPSPAPGQRLVAGAMGLLSGDDEGAYRIFTELVADTRRAGMIGLLPNALEHLAISEVFLGRIRDAHTHIAEGLALARSTGQEQRIDQFGCITAWTAAMSGDSARCRALAEPAIDRALELGVARSAGWAALALALLDIVEGRHAALLERFEGPTARVITDHPNAIRYAPDRVEAAARLGEPARAAQPMARFTAWAEASGQPWAEGVVLRCRALLTPDARAGTYFEQAVARHQLDARPFDRPFQRARTQLLYGEWLRRARRRADARIHLVPALATFEELGAVPWADRCRGELRATGAGDPAPTPQHGRSARAVDAYDTLTPQEQQVVDLAAQGLSNRDIAAQLFLSPRTVGYHLYKAYPKLGITSRSDLRVPAS